jgi:hypothetical protein
MLNNTKLIFFKGSLGCWSTLGFYRGVAHYNYNNREPKKQTSLYSITFMNATKKIAYTGFYGVTGMLVYTNPLFLPNNISREIYRFEVCARGLEDEKKTLYYNSIL